MIKLRARALKDLQTYCESGLRLMSTRSDQVGPCPTATSRAGVYNLVFTGMRTGRSSLCRLGVDLKSAWIKFERLADTPGLEAVCSDQSHASSKSPCNIDLPGTIKDGVARSERETVGVCLECESEHGTLIARHCEHNDVFRVRI